MRCSLCGKPIDTANDYRKVTGWERIRRLAGGTNAIAVPERKDVYACWECVGRQKRGVAVGQQELV